MDLLQCVTPSLPARKSPSRQVRSEEREIRRQANGPSRRISLPAGNYAVSHNSASRGTTPAAQSSGKPEFRHYGSSLSISGKSVASELTSRTLRPPSPTVLRKLSTTSTSSTKSTSSTLSSGKPPLPNAKVDLEPPKLADYLEKPRYVSTMHIQKSPGSTLARPSQQHSKRSPFDVGVVVGGGGGSGGGGSGEYRNLRLGNFMENEEEEDEIIPERLRQYYLETFLNVCDTCQSMTHCHPNHPLHRGM